MSGTKTSPSHKITWIDHNREPQCASNPLYPNGMAVDASNGAKLTCVVDLPYPAKRCGVYRIECTVCGFIAAITTAGRLDDPRSVKIPCKMQCKKH